MYLGYNEKCEKRNHGSNRTIKGGHLQTSRKEIKITKEYLK